MNEYRLNIMLFILIRYTLEMFPEEDIAKFPIRLVDAGSFSGAKGI